MAYANDIERHERFGPAQKVNEPKAELKALMPRWAIERLHNNREITRMFDVLYSPYRTVWV